jgi:hypothetical protein
MGLRPDINLDPPFRISRFDSSTAMLQALAPHQALRLRAVPFWLIFNGMPSLHRDRRGEFRHPCNHRERVAQLLVELINAVIEGFPYQDINGWGANTRLLASGCRAITSRSALNSNKSRLLRINRCGETGHRGVTMSHSSEEGENYWPGYVDALTSMVQVLAFVMMMLAMAVFVLSQSVSKKAVEAIAKAVNAEVKPNADIKQLTQSIVEQVDRLRASPPSGAAADNTLNVKPSQAAEAVERPNTMRISGGQSQPSSPALDDPPDAPRMTVAFADRSFRIDGEQSQSVAKFVDENQGTATGRTIVIHAYAYSGEGAISEARRLAYYRAMMARKQLVDAKIRPENIRIGVNDTADKAKGLTVELIVSGGAR